jgi:hypothetical protein
MQTRLSKWLLIDRSTTTMKTMAECTGSCTQLSRSTGKMSSFSRKHGRISRPLGDGRKHEKKTAPVAPSSHILYTGDELPRNCIWHLRCRTGSDCDFAQGGRGVRPYTNIIESACRRCRLVRLLGRLLLLRLLGLRAPAARGGRLGRFFPTRGLWLSPCG